MAHEIAKLMLERAESFASRTAAVQAALDLGMPLAEIEAYLDWLELVRWGCCQDDKLPKRSSSDNESGPFRASEGDR